MYRWAVPILLVFFLLAIFGLLLGESLWLTTQVVRVSDVTGTVEMCPKGQSTWRRVDVGTLVKKGDHVRTRHGGRALLVWMDRAHTRLRLEQDAEIEVKSCNVDKKKDRTDTVFNLVKGRVWLRVKPRLTAGSKFEVHTPEAVASVRGTTFAVETGGGKTKVSVREGQVDVVAGTQRVAVPAGQLAETTGASAPVANAMPDTEVEAWKAQQDVLRPYLKILLPLPGQTVHGTVYTVRGVTDPECKVTVNGVAGVMGDGGRFTADVPLTQGAQELKIESRSPEDAVAAEVRQVICRPR
jgi:hypothetical protein